MAKRGATFWEILGVLLIITIVAVVVFPVFAKAHHTGWRHGSCLINQKQIGLGLLQYTQDYDNLMPNISDTPGSINTWRNEIWYYVKSKSIYRCPDDTAPDGPDGFPPSYAANYSGNYSNGSLDKGNGAFAGAGSHPLSLAKFADPAHLILLCEVQNSNRPEFNIDDAIHFGPDKHILAPRHSDGSNYLFADGHSRWLRPLNTAGFWYRDTNRPLSANAAAVLKEARMDSN